MGSFTIRTAPAGSFCGCSVTFRSGRSTRWVSDVLPTPPSVNLSAVQNPVGAVIGIAPDFRAGYAQQFNLMLQHEVAPLQTVIKAAYVGNLGRRIGTSFNLNLPVPGPG